MTDLLALCLRCGKRRKQAHLYRTVTRFIHGECAVDRIAELEALVWKIRWPIRQTDQGWVVGDVVVPQSVTFATLEEAKAFRSALDPLDQIGEETQ